MILSNLKKLVATYHRQAVAALTVDGFDMFLASANNAIEAALQKHNFNAARITATLSIDGETGGALNTAQIVGDQPTVTVTGTLSPDATGTYTKVGTAYGANMYTRGFDYILFYRNGVWTLQSFNSGLEINEDSWGLTSPGVAGSYTPNEGAVNTGTAVVAVANLSPFTDIREITAISRSDAQGHAIPLDYTNPDAALERDRYQLSMSDDFSTYYRYPSDADILNRTGNGTLIQRGSTLYIYPHSTENTSPVVVLLEGYGQLAELTSSNLNDTQPSNFLIQYGSEWMQWFIITELNMYFKTFVGRTEGNLAPPEQQRELAWQRLMVADSYLVDGHTTRER